MRSEMEVKEKLWELEIALNEAGHERPAVEMAVLFGTMENYEMELMDMEINSIEKQIQWLQWVLEE